jgi:hypothetical protein
LTRLPRLEIRIRVITRLLVAAYFIEAGLLLVLAPWTTWWHRNYFADLAPWLSGVMATMPARVAFMAAGLITALAGIFEGITAFAGRHAGESPPL